MTCSVMSGHVMAYHGARHVTYQNRLRGVRAKPVHATVHELVLRARFEADFGTPKSQKPGFP